MTHTRTRTRTHTHTHTHTHTELECFMHDCFTIELTGECLKCLFRLTGGVPAVVVQSEALWARIPEIQVRIPSRAMGTFFPHTVSSIFRLSLTHTHTHTHLCMLDWLFFINYSIFGARRSHFMILNHDLVRCIFFMLVFLPCHCNRILYLIRMLSTIYFHSANCSSYFAIFYQLNVE